MKEWPMKMMSIEFSTANAPTGVSWKEKHEEMNYVIEIVNFRISEIVFKCSGRTGHGSILFKDTAGEKLSYITQKLYEFRKTQLEKLESDPNLEEGDVCCVNLTIVSGGVLFNVIPDKFSATFDMRLVPDFDLKAFEKQVRSFDIFHKNCNIYLQLFETFWTWKKWQLNDWCKEAGGGIEIEFLYRDENTPDTVTHLNDDNKYWVAMKKALTDDLYVHSFKSVLMFISLLSLSIWRNVKFKTLIMPGNTDMWFVRSVSQKKNFTLKISFDHIFTEFQLHIPAISISPTINTPNREHENDEFIFAEQYLRGIEIYKKILQRIANLN